MFHPNFDLLKNYFYLFLILIETFQSITEKSSLNVFLTYYHKIFKGIRKKFKDLFRSWKNLFQKRSVQFLLKIEVLWHLN